MTEKATPNKFIVFTDGSSLGNPGPGGYGAIIYETKDSQVLEIGGYENQTTNNRMELRASIESLLAIRSSRKDNEPTEITIHTDSAYVINGITKWVRDWERNNWMTGKKESVLNQDLWQALSELARWAEDHGGMVWKKVSGHSGVPGNERVDVIATSFAEEKPVELFSGVISDYEEMIGGSLATVSPSASAKPKKSTRKKKGEAYSYVSLVDGEIYTDKTWDDCEKRVIGRSGVKFKKVSNKEEEQELIALWSLESLDSTGA